ncbi:MAG: hypothetical protein JRJ76_09965, partial [Deltaproteobacteria bacterium]|nr:hypothetical protein [Deltaproteobacteria bacterium]
VYTRKTGLFSKPEISRKLADLAMEVEMLKTLTYETIWKMNNGINVIYEPSRDKATADRLHEKMSRVGLEILGAFAQMDSLYKDARWVKLKGAFEHMYYTCPAIAIAAGTTNTQRNIVGQFGLQLPRAY